MYFSHTYQKEKKFFTYCESKINKNNLKRRKVKYNYQPLSSREKNSTVLPHSDFFFLSLLLGAQFGF